MSISCRLRALQLEQDGIHAKRARLTRFENKQARDSWLNGQIQDITSNLTVRQNQLNVLTEEHRAAQEELVLKTQAIEELKERNQSRYDNRLQLANEETQLKQQRDEVTEKRKDLWREEAKLDSMVRNSTDEMRNAEKALAGSVDKVRSKMYRCVCMYLQMYI
jgi:structural maintenance of chromosome 3 (chondroitin sulfate proteoglycan 6)